MLDWVWVILEALIGQKRDSTWMQQRYHRRWLLASLDPEEQVNSCHAQLGRNFSLCVFVCMHSWR